MFRDLLGAPCRSLIPVSKVSLLLALQGLRRLLTWVGFGSTISYISLVVAHYSGEADSLGVDNATQQAVLDNYNTTLTRLGLPHPDPSEFVTGANTSQAGAQFVLEYIARTFEVSNGHSVQEREPRSVDIDFRHTK